MSRDAVRSLRKLFELGMGQEGVHS